MSVKAALTPNRAGRVTETAEFAAFVRRIIRAYGRRIGQGGDVDALPELVALAAELDAVIGQSVAGLRAEGYSWGEISSRLGTTRQAAQQRFGRATPPAAMRVVGAIETTGRTLGQSIAEHRSGGADQ